MEGGERQFDGVGEIADGRCDRDRFGLGDDRLQRAAGALVCSGTDTAPTCASAMSTVV